MWHIHIETVCMVTVYSCAHTCTPHMFSYTCAHTHSFPKPKPSKGPVLRPGFPETKGCLALGAALDRKHQKAVTGPKPRKLAGPQGLREPHVCSWARARA